MRGSETVKVIPTIHVDRLRPAEGDTEPSYDLEGCYVLPRVSPELERGVVGVAGFDVYYFGTDRPPRHDWKVEVRGETHEIEDEPRDFRIKGRRKALVFTTKKVGS